jgi:hypothetical protein
MARKPARFVRGQCPGASPGGDSAAVGERGSGGVLLGVGRCQESSSGPSDRRTARRPRTGQARGSARMGLDRVTDPAEDGADLAAQEQQGKDCDDRDERKDQGVFGQPLASLTGSRRKDESADTRQHRYRVLLSSKSLAWSKGTRRPAGPSIGSGSRGSVPVGAPHYGAVARVSIHEADPAAGDTAGAGRCQVGRGSSMPGNRATPDPRGARRRVVVS